MLFREWYTMSKRRRNRYPKIRNPVFRLNFEAVLDVRIIKAPVWNTTSFKIQCGVLGYLPLQTRSPSNFSIF